MPPGCRPTAGDAHTGLCIVYSSEFYCTWFGQKGMMALLVDYRFDFHCMLVEVVIVLILLVQPISKIWNLWSRYSSRRNLSLFDLHSELSVEFFWWGAKLMIFMILIVSIYWFFSILSIQANCRICKIPLQMSLDIHEKNIGNLASSILCSVKTRWLSSEVQTP